MDSLNLGKSQWVQDDYKNQITLVAIFPIVFRARMSILFIVKVFKVFSLIK